jgi:hypothetical protein
MARLTMLPVNTMNIWDVSGISYLTGGVDTDTTRSDEGYVVMEDDFDNGDV